MRVQVRLLGRFEAVVDGRLVPARSWQRQSASRLVKLLALQPTRRLHREQVIDALWPDVDLDTGGARLHSAAHYARTALGSPHGVVVAQGVVSVFPDAEVAVDVEAFERALAAARLAGDVQAAAAAVALYAGSLLPDDLYEPWTEEARSRLHLGYREMLHAAGLYDALVADDPLDEEAQLGLAQDLLRQGRRRDAVQALDRMAEVFERELGVDLPAAARALRAEAEVGPADGLIAPVASSSGATAAAPVAASQTNRSTLPAERSRLIGRERDLDEVGALLRQHRVVTITGPGGAGKSTLALAHGRRVQADGAGPNGPDGPADVVFAELAPVRDADEVTRAVAEAFGLEGEAAVETSALAAILGTRPVLLVLDNCEHLLDASAGFVDAVLDAGDAARVLVTSREPLRVDGEAVHALGSLGKGAVELFVERAAAVAGGHAAPSVDDPKVKLLCERLDGLPLAVELAAAQLRHLSLDELVARLDDRLTLLAGGRPRAGSRHSALAATIDWSYQLLPSESQDVFARLAAFPASFDLDAVVAVSGGLDAAAVTKIVGDLVAKSLVVHEPSSGRYRLLETIRLFAGQRLCESGRDDEVVELLRQHVVRRATSTSRIRAWLSPTLAAQSRDDLDNVRLAFELSVADGHLADAVDIAIAISTLWRNAVSYAEGRSWVGELLSRDLVDADRIWALLLSADIGLGAGDPRAMRRGTTAALQLADSASNAAAATLAAIYEAVVHLDDPPLATRRLEEAAARAREIGEPDLERLARGYRLLTVRMQGPSDALDAEASQLADTSMERGYDLYICIWAASMLALVDLDSARLRRLMDTQLVDLAATGLRENWLTMYWGALALILEGNDHLDQLRRSRARADAEGRNSDADSVLALAIAAACDDEWERAASLIGAVADVLLHDTAGFIQLTLIRDQLVRPHLDRTAYVDATSRGRDLAVEELLAEHGI